MNARSTSGAKAKAGGAGSRRTAPLPSVAARRRVSGKSPPAVSALPLPAGPSGRFGRALAAKTAKAAKTGRWAAALAAVWLVSFGAGTAGAAPLCLDVRGGAVHRYEVEVAATPAARAQGLMFRRSLAPGSGMLFDFGRDEVARMWMKNTFIPLDMVFADRRGVVRGIARNARPRSLDTISSRVPVRAVLEISGGEAERIGLAPGDRMRHPVFGTGCGD